MVWLAALALLALSVAAYWPQLDWRMRMVIPFRPQYAYAGLGLLLVGRWLGAGRLLKLLCVAVAAVNLWVLWPYYTPPVDTSAGEPLRVMTWNTWSDHPDPAQILQSIARSGQDAVLLCEIPTAWRGRPAPPVEGYKTVLEAEFMAAFREGSDLKMVSHALARRPRGLQAEATWQGRPLRLLVTHQARPTTRGMQRMQEYRQRELLKWLAASDLPTIVAGDFNQTPWCPLMANLLTQSNLKDSARGRGVSPTYPCDLPLVRWLIGVPIDHCLYTPELACGRRRVLSGIGSNHCPVAIELGWRTPPPR